MEVAAAAAAADCWCGAQFGQCVPTSLEEMRAGDGGGLCRRIGLVGSNYVL